MGQVILCGTLLTGSDGETLEGAALRLSEGRIVSVHADYGASVREAGDEVLDLRHATVLPGLIDLHDHLNGDGKYSIGDDSIEPPEAVWALVAAHYARGILRKGITTARVPGAALHVDIALRQMIAEGMAIGPRLVCAGKPICMTGGHGFGMSREADGPYEVMKATREQIKAGADFIKLLSTGGVGITREGEDPTQPEMTVEEMAAGVGVAHRAGLRVTAHCDGLAGIRNALAAGLDCLEHGIFLEAAEAEEMARRGIALVPTLSTMVGILAYGAEGKVPASWIPVAESVIEPHKDSFKAALDAGVLFGTGTDGFGNIVDELLCFVGAGLTPLRALQAATRDGARIMGLEKSLGTLEPGKHADLIAVAGDPLEDLELLRAPGLVMRAGTIWLVRPEFQSEVPASMHAEVPA